jgi:hypothetical protein
MINGTLSRDVEMVESGQQVSHKQPAEEAPRFLLTAPTKPLMSTLL